MVPKLALVGALLLAIPLTGCVTDRPASAGGEVTQVTQDPVEEATRVYKARSLTILLDTFRVIENASRTLHDVVDGNVSRVEAGKLFHIYASDTASLMDDMRSLNPPSSFAWLHQDMVSAIRLTNNAMTSMEDYIRTGRTEDLERSNKYIGDAADALDSVLVRFRDGR